MFVKAKPDVNGFFSIEDTKPTEYDLCILVGKNGRTAMGWRTGGTNFDGSKIDRIDEVVAWKKSKEI